MSREARSYIRSSSSRSKKGTSSRCRDSYAVLPDWTMIGPGSRPRSAARSISASGRTKGISQVPRTTKTMRAAAVSEQRSDVAASRVRGAHLLPLDEELVRDGIDRGGGGGLGVDAAEGKDVDDFAAHQLAEIAEGDRRVTAGGHDRVRTE